MKQFEHPNLLPCLTSLVVGGQVWVVTPLAEWARSVDLLHTHLYSLCITYYLLQCSGFVTTRNFPLWAA